MSGAIFLARGRLLQPHHHHHLALRIAIQRRGSHSSTSSSISAAAAGEASSSSLSSSANVMAPSSSPPSDEAELLARLRRLVPPLSSLSHKGSHGKVGVVGGCAEYTGAPFFAAMSALRAGADLAYVFCTPAAAPVIKSYSPELIVLPCLPESTKTESARRAEKEDDDDDDEAAAAASLALAHAEPWIARLGCLIVGPGLGDDPRTCAAARELLLAARRLRIPLIVDGSAINFVSRDAAALLKGERLLVLTPNMAELGRLAVGAGVALRGEAISAEWQAQVGELADALEGPVVVSKGPADVVAMVRAAEEQQQQGARLLTCTSPASLKRSGGQGDVLTGIMAALICWSFAGSGSSQSKGGEDATSDAATSERLALAAYGACWLMRAASASAFAAKGRAMLAGDILDPHVAGAIVRLERSGGG